MATLPTLDSSLPKPEIVRALQAHLAENAFTVVQADETRPWGAFLRVQNSQADEFIRTYFQGVELPPPIRHGERSPKILLVAPHQRLSWQHHDRRSEFWRVVGGSVGVCLSATDQQPSTVKRVGVGETVEIPLGLRHRLVGLDEWGVVAEIWSHADPGHPSDEDDIHRHQDDYARTV